MMNEYHLSESSLHWIFIMSTTVFEFGSIVKDFNQFSTWLKKKKLIKKEILCGECVSSMKEVAGQRPWICSKRKLHPSGKLVRESQLKGTVFEGARASPETIMELCFALRLTYDQTMAQTKVSRPTVSRWCHPVCMLWF